MNTATKAAQGDTRTLQAHRKLKARRRVPRQTPSSGPPQPGKPLKQDTASLKEAIRIAQKGDAAAFETIYQMHSRRVYALCLRMVGDPMEAEDLTQEAFLQLFRKIHTFRGESAFSSWLHRRQLEIRIAQSAKAPTRTLASGAPLRFPSAAGDRLSFHSVQMTGAANDAPSGRHSLFRVKWKTVGLQDAAEGKQEIATSS